MIRKFKKKAFTLVELLVVIAILAILATVSIVGYGAFTKKAKESNDIYLVKQMNIVLDASKVVDGKNKTMTDALDDVFDKGYDLTKLTPTSSKYNIVWDSVNDQMVLLNDFKEVVFPNENVSDKKDLYVIVSTDDEIKNTYKDYSFYLRDNFNNNQETPLAISNGIDVGNNENIKSIIYNNATKHTVSIRTNGGTLSINAANDTINHFGWVKELNISAVATNDCYHEYGFVGSLKVFTSGKLVAHEESQFHQSKEEVESKIGTNQKNIEKAKFNEHKYDENGVCYICNTNDPNNPNYDIIPETAALKIHDTGANNCLELDTSSMGELANQVSYYSVNIKYVISGYVSSGNDVIPNGETFDFELSFDSRDYVIDGIPYICDIGVVYDYDTEMLGKLKSKDGVRVGFLSPRGYDINSFDQYYMYFSCSDLLKKLNADDLGVEYDYPEYNVAVYNSNGKEIAKRTYNASEKLLHEQYAIKKEFDYDPIKASYLKVSNDGLYLNLINDKSIIDYQNYSINLDIIFGIRVYDGLLTSYCKKYDYPDLTYGQSLNDNKFLYLKCANGDKSFDEYLSDEIISISIDENVSFDLKLVKNDKEAFLRIEKVNGSFSKPDNGSSYGNMKYKLTIKNNDTNEIYTIMYEKYANDNLYELSRE